jgi:hypothetical protein
MVISGKKRRNIHFEAMEVTNLVNRLFNKKQWRKVQLYPLFVRMKEQQRSVVYQ